MHTRSGKKYKNIVALSWLRSGTCRTLSKGALNVLTARARLPSSAPTPRGAIVIGGDDGSSLSLAPRAITTLVPSVSFRPDGTFTPCIGRALWTLARETPRARVYVGKNWSARPWDDDLPDRRGFVARFRWGSENHVVHVSDDGATVAFLVETLDEVVPLSVTGIASRACGVLNGSTTLRELVARERRAYTVDDVGEIVVFATS